MSRSSFPFPRDRGVAVCVWGSAVRSQEAQLVACTGGRAVENSVLAAVLMRSWGGGASSPIRCLTVRRGIQISAESGIYDTRASAPFSDRMNFPVTRFPPPPGSSPRTQRKFCRSTGTGPGNWRGRNWTWTTLRSSWMCQFPTCFETRSLCSMR